MDPTKCLTGGKIMSHVAIITAIEGFLPGGVRRSKSSRFESLRAANDWAWSFRCTDPTRNRHSVEFVEDSREPQIWDREVYPDES